MPYRFPVHPGRLHRHMRHPMPTQELVALEQCRGGRRKRLHFIVRGLRNTADTRHDAILMHVKPSTARIQHVHTASRMIAMLMRRQEKPLLSKSNIRAPERKRSWQQFGVLAGSPVQLANGLAAPRTNRPRSRRRVDPNPKPRRRNYCSYASCLGVARSAMEN